MADLLIFIVVLGTLIIGHEFGHLLIAKACRVRVDEFGVGFPPRLTTLFTAAGTRFTLNAIPLGGFVRPAGEDDPSVVGGLAGAPKRVRTAVLLAGPAANVLLAFIAFTAAFKFAAPDSARVLVTGISAGSPAATTGIQTGDIITSVDSQPITGFPSLQKAIADRLGQPVVIGLLRNGQALTVQLTPRLNPPVGQGPLGVITGNPTKATTWGQSLAFGAGSLGFQVNELLHLPARLLRNEIPADQARLSGLKGMYDMLSWAGEVDRSSQRPFLTLNLIGLISTGLALANLLPIPALDGGRLMFVLIEAILGRRISPRYEGLAHAIGFALLIALMLYVNLQDFINPIALPH